MIKEFREYLMSIQNAENREKISSLLDHLQMQYPKLSPKISWGMPIFTSQNTYILGISAFKEHFSIAPEPIAVLKFADEIKQSGYQSTKGLFKIKWTDEINYVLLYKIIDFNIADKANCKTFWRK